MRITEADLGEVRRLAREVGATGLVKVVDEVRRLRTAIEAWVAARSTEGCHACEALNALTVLLDYDSGEEEP